MMQTVVHHYNFNSMAPWRNGIFSWLNFVLVFVMTLFAVFKYAWLKAFCVRDDEMALRIIADRTGVWGPVGESSLCGTFA